MHVLFFYVFVLKTTSVSMAELLSDLITRVIFLFILYILSKINDDNDELNKLDKITSSNLQ